jgi:hypothetical protein
MFRETLQPKTHQRRTQASLKTRSKATGAAQGKRKSIQQCFGPMEHTPLKGMAKRLAQRSTKIRRQNSKRKTRPGISKRRKQHTTRTTLKHVRGLKQWLPAKNNNLHNALGVNHKNSTKME